ncbi:MAG: sn-glycerol-3-phosphate ABC transporter ATP-binding protein UgpC [Candidatus Gastranaerophilales bacterium]|nr:sn-glycerol-3-phosphate ABC transporter ATP-binding protein UgpC [Candidatus Gastranaerophilales bacterium]
MAKVELVNISKSYDQTETIKNINLEIKDKEFIVLVGPSGCGKSTILRMIAGLEDITSGDIVIGERVVNDVPPKDRNIAMVFQNYALYPHMNVYDNMAFGLKMRKFKKDVIDQRVREAAGILDLTEYLNRKPKQLSGGQRQRVALGRAIVRDPLVFLMDEPLSNLDAKLRVQMRSEIKKLHSRLQTTFIYVTHDQVEAMTMGDRIVILDKGFIQQIDTPDAVYSKPENMFVASFIGSPAMNFINVKISQNAFKIDDQSIQISGELIEVIKNNNLENQEVILGIRPEHFGAVQKEAESLKVFPELVEMLGSEKLIHFNLNNKSITAKLPSDFKVHEEQELMLQLNISKCLLFDPKTQIRYKK